MAGATTFSGNVTQGSFKPKDSLKYSVNDQSKK